MESMRAGGRLLLLLLFRILLLYYTTLNKLNKWYKILWIYQASQHFYWTGSVQVILALQQQYFTRFYNKRCNQMSSQKIIHAHALQHSRLNNFMQ